MLIDEDIKKRLIKKETFTDEIRKIKHRLPIMFEEYCIVCGYKTLHEKKHGEPECVECQRFQEQDNE